MGNSASEGSGSIFDYEVQDGNSQPYAMANLRGKKAFLIVNTASE
jgi:glutathione peroxidase-family protein